MRFIRVPVAQEATEYLTQTLDQCEVSADTKAEIIFRIAEKDVAEKRWQRFLSNLDDGIALVIGTGTVLLLLQGGINYHATQWFQSIEWLKAPVAKEEEPKATATQITQTTSTTTAVRPSSNFREKLSVGDDVAGYPVTSGFGVRDTRISGASTFHQGVDLGTDTGTPVRMIGNGTVTCGEKQYNGIYAIAQPSALPDTQFYYLHLDSCNGSGEYKSGDVIGFSGATGVGSGPHLHFAQKVNGTFIDPDRGYVEWAITGVEPTESAAAPTTSDVNKVVKIDLGQGLYGAGSLVSANGKIITNHHVIAGLDKNNISVTLFDGRTFKGKVIKDGGEVNSINDIAIIQLEGASDLPYFELGQSPAAKSKVTLLGHPQLNGAKEQTMFHISECENLEQTSTGLGQLTKGCLSPGNSGGAVTVDGRYVGMPTMGESERGLPDRYIPVEIISKFMN